MGTAFELICDMDRSARVYAALRSPEEGYWTAEERDSLAQLQIFNVRQPLAVLLAAFERFEENDRGGFGRFLKAIAVVSFRYNVICSRQSNEQEVVYNQVARGISSGRIDGAAAAIAELRPVYPEDAEKRPVYAESSFAITRKLSEDFDTWTVEKIRTHQAWMAKQATGIWRIQFPLTT